jgi:hypothetical protein
MCYFFTVETQTSKCVIHCLFTYVGFDHIWKSQVLVAEDALVSGAGFSELKVYVSTHVSVWLLLTDLCDGMLIIHNVYSSLLTLPRPVLLAHLSQYCRHSTRLQSSGQDYSPH